jgi:hypothetical protein
MLLGQRTRCNSTKTEANGHRNSEELNGVDMPCSAYSKSVRGQNSDSSKAATAATKKPTMICRTLQIACANGLRLTT